MKSINRIFLFGDSWIEGQGCYEKIENNNFHEPSFNNETHTNLLRDWRRKTGWNIPLNELTSCEIINYGVQGSDNYSQFGELNNILPILTDRDLVVIGFTSKLRDSNSLNYYWKLHNSNSLLSQDNPLRGHISWEKKSVQVGNFGLTDDSKTRISFSTKNELEFTEKFIEDYLVSLYNDVVYEHIAQCNYFFLQERFKSLGLNLVCFDLFEPYVDKKYVSENLNIDKNVYITFGEKSMNDFLIEYEIKHIKENDIPIWENGDRRPDLKGFGAGHPNQHGYKLIIDYIFKDILSKQYKFIK
jgi:hypothetical protein